MFLHFTPLFPLGMKQGREFVWISSTRLLPSCLQSSFRSSWELWHLLSPIPHQCAERGCMTSSCGSRTTTGTVNIFGFCSHANYLSYFCILLVILFMPKCSVVLTSYKIMQHGFKIGKGWFIYYPYNDTVTLYGQWTAYRMWSDRFTVAYRQLLTLWCQC